MSKKISIKQSIKNLIPFFLIKALNRIGIIKHYIPPVKKISFGDFKSVVPFSKQFGYDRGGAIDRYYIESFLKSESGKIKGTVLEIGDNYYTQLFGGSQVEKSEILHIDESNPSATIIADISNAPHINDNSFDCIILTQTLHLIYNYKEALQTCHRILKPGGTLLLTVPGITPIDYGEWNNTWYYSFTDKAMVKMMKEIFANSEININVYGNVFVATCFLYGLGLNEIPKDKLDYIDPQYQVIISVKATKL